MRARVFTSLTILVLAGLAFQPQPAQAEEAKPNLAEAKAAFKAGAKALKSKDYVTAVKSFKKAFEITQDGLVMGQVATAYEKAGDFEAALEAIEVYKASLPTKDQASVDSLIKKYRAKIRAGKSKKLEIPEEQPAEPTLAAPPPAEVKPAAPPSAPAEGSTEVVEGQTETQVEGAGDAGAPPADQAAASGEAATAEASADAAGTEEKPKRFYTWIAAGGAAALALSGLVVGLNAQSKYDELDDRCAPGCSDSDVDSVKTRALVADVLFGVAAGAAITAGVLYFLEGRDAAGSAPAQEQAARQQKRLRFTPVAGASTFGLNADMRF